MRSSNATLDSALSNHVINRIALVKLMFDSFTLAWNTGFSNIVYGGITYLGVGALASITPVNEEAGVKPTSLSVGVSGVKSEVLAMFLQEPYMNRKAYVYECFTGEDLVFNPTTTKLVFVGTIDSINGKFGSSSMFTVELKSRLADWERSINLRYTDADQQKLHPGDKFMQYIPQLSKKKLVWPKAAALLDPRD